MPDNAEIRKYIRHPSDIPIQVEGARVDEYDDLDDTLTNISIGGLSFLSVQQLELSQKIKISIPLIKQDNFLEGRVIRCEKIDGGYEVGLQFNSTQEVFRLRMIEQICHIEHYRKEVERDEGRELTSEEAAKEWISRYAGDFPAM